jgi:hypothetical protein
MQNSIKGSKLNPEKEETKCSSALKEKKTRSRPQTESTQAPHSKKRFETRTSKILSTLKKMSEIPYSEKKSLHNSKFTTKTNTNTTTKRTSQERHKEKANSNSRESNSEFKEIDKLDELVLEKSVHECSVSLSHTGISNLPLNKSTNSFKRSLHTHSNVLPYNYTEVLTNFKTPKRKAKNYSPSLALNSNHQVNQISSSSCDHLREPVTRVNIVNIIPSVKTYPNKKANSDVICTDNLNHDLSVLNKHTYPNKSALSFLTKSNSSISPPQVRKVNAATSASQHVKSHTFVQSREKEINSDSNQFINSGIDYFPPISSQASSLGSDFTSEPIYHPKFQISIQDDKNTVLSFTRKNNKFKYQNNTNHHGIL